MRVVMMYLSWDGIGLDEVKDNEKQTEKDAASNGGKDKVEVGFDCLLLCGKPAFAWCGIAAGVGLSVFVFHASLWS